VIPMLKNKQDKQALVPKLRFPEFRGNKEWNRLNGNKLFTPINDRDHNGDLPVLAITQEHGAIPRALIDYNVSVTQSSIDSYKIIRVGDFIISLRSFQGGIEYSDYEGICSPAYVVLKEKCDTVAAFFKHLFKSKAFIRELTKNLEGLRDGKMISFKQFSEVLINLPSKPEQQKIADGLDSLDDLIAAHSTKLDALQDHKKGLLQQLFPAEGQTTPTLRFPEFEDAGEWKDTRIGELIVEYRQKSIKENEHEVLTSARGGLIRQKEYYENNRITERSNIGFNVVPLNYITYRSRSDDRTFYFNENNLGITGVISTYYPVFRIKSGSNKFFIELFSHHREAIGKRSVGTSQTVLSLNELRKVKLAIPSKIEQQRIANCLSALDGLITAQTAQIAALKDHKKALMQQLFPNPELSKK